MQDNKKKEEDKEKMVCETSQTNSLICASIFNIF